MDINPSRHPLPIDDTTCFRLLDVRVYDSPIADTGADDDTDPSCLTFTDLHYFDAMNLAALAVENGKSVQIVPAPV